MPTTRPRHMVTETDELARALDAAARRWPADRNNRAKLLRRLLDEGCRAIRVDQDEAVAARRQAIDRTAGSLSGVFGDGYLDRLREDWPA